ncbi:hypothetical protein Y032_0008g242 [Ancylostoma ceylanicum]|uniref:Uncharacterized protein n=1 Tax=Ancylostoma ceylanicum TaxID=53326 RepID=A0A016VJV0_9BILA|nr:hypothetical protein Y032_0008g242 [Ancylostoma ceylanicum]
MSVKTFTLGNLNDACGPFFVRQRFVSQYESCTRGRMHQWDYPGWGSVNYSLLAQGVPMERLCLQLRPRSYRPADRLVLSETVVKHLSGRDHTTGVKNGSNQPIA